MKPLFYGAAFATLAGLVLGGAIKPPIEPTSLYGQQLLVSQARTRTPTAFDLWQPTEAGPMGSLPQTAWAAPSLGDVERGVARLLRTEEVEIAYRPDPPPSDLAEAEPPEPYLPSTRGDILASGDARLVALDLPPADPPRWGWREARAPREDIAREDSDDDYAAMQAYDRPRRYAPPPEDWRDDPGPAPLYAYRGD